MKHVYASNYEEILDGLRSGALVGADRGTGKTEAVLQYAHEVIAKEPVTIIAHNHDVQLRLRRRWIDKFGSNKIPNFAFSEDQVRCLSGKIVVDELGHSKYDGHFDAAIW